MIKNFRKFNKINENWELQSELIDEVDDSIIDKYFEDNYEIDFSEIANSSNIRNHINDDAYIQQWIDSDINNNTFEEYNDWDFKKYIKKFLTDDKEAKILELYNDNNYDEDDEDDEKTTEFDEDLIDDLDDDQLKEVIEDDDGEYEFIEYMVNKRYKGMSAMDLIDEIYGDLEEQEQNSDYVKYGFGNKPHTLLDEVGDFVDEDAVVKEWKSEYDWTSRKEYAQSAISQHRGMQKSILESDPKNILQLAELFEEEGGGDIGNDFDFQDTYVKEYEKENNVYDEGEEEYEEEKSLQIETALEYIDDNFDLDFDEFEKLYPKEMKDIIIKKDAAKYNM